MKEFEWILEEFKSRRGRSSADSTVDVYARQVRYWRDWLQKNRDKTLWEAETADLRLRIEKMTDEGKAPTTINKQVAAISKFYQDCSALTDYHDMPDIPPNPYDGLNKDDKKFLRGDTKKKAGLEDRSTDEFPYLEPEKIQQLVENVPSPRLRNELIIKLLFNCGFRRGELTKVKIEQIDREDNSIFIPPQKSSTGRYVPFNEDYLGFQLRRWLDEGLRDSRTYASESEYLFPTDRMERLTGGTINTIVKQAAENAGLQETIAEYSDGRESHKVTPHTLRHSFAMQMLNSGVDIRKLQTLLGHDELDTTLIYLQQSKEGAKEAGRMFEPEA